MTFDEIKAELSRVDDEDTLLYRLIPPPEIEKARLAEYVRFRQRSSKATNEYKHSLRVLADALFDAEAKLAAFDDYKKSRKLR